MRSLAGPADVTSTNFCLDIRPDLRPDLRLDIRPDPRPLEEQSDLDCFLLLELALRNIDLAGLSGSLRFRRHSRSNIPDSAGFRSSSLLLWMVWMVSVMLSSSSEISRLLRVTCLQIDLQQVVLNLGKPFQRENLSLLVDDQEAPDASSLLFIEDIEHLAELALSVRDEGDVESPREESLCPRCLNPLGVEHSGVSGAGNNLT